MYQLKKRSEFLTVAKGMRTKHDGFILQSYKRNRNMSFPLCESEILPIRIGFTVTKKIGTAPIRNRIKRRLRPAWELAYPEIALPGYDYVLIGRRYTLTIPFTELVDGIMNSLTKLVKEP